MGILLILAFPPNRWNSNSISALQLFYIMPLSINGAEIFGEIKASYKRNSDKKLKKGILEKHNVDFMIASSAIDYEAVLISNDKIFKQIQILFPKLMLEDWTM